MILAANVGVGLLGKEGQQAALSSDFSIETFEYLAILILWHGRLAYKNTALMAQFVIHRGLIIAFITVFFSVIFYFAAIPLFTGVLMVGYTCVYTSLPVFSLVLDRDVSFSNSLFFPELYHPLQSGRALNGRTFLLWVMRSFFSGIGHHAVHPHSVRERAAPHRQHRVQRLNSDGTVQCLHRSAPRPYSDVAVRGLLHCAVPRVGAPSLCHVL